MLDLHCHILPGVDDGAQTLDDSLDMAYAAVKEGVTHILCTPHHNNGVYLNPKNEVRQRVSALQKELDDRLIPLTLFEGQEIRISGDLPARIAAGEIQFIDLEEKYLLIEFPSMDIPAYTQQLFMKLFDMGKRPIIVHPERNAKIIEAPNRLLDFLDMGVLTQLTAPSYIGTFGKKIQKTAKLLVEHNLVQMMASDAHGINKRSSQMKVGYEKMAQDFGLDKVMKMQQTAKDLINGELIYPTDYEGVAQKRFGLF